MRSGWPLMLIASVLLSCATARPIRVATPVVDAWSDRMYSPFDEAAFKRLAASAIDVDQLQSELIGAAIWRETNLVRVRHGLRALAYCPACRAAAQRYSDDMVERDFFRADHSHPDSSLATPHRRMDAAKLTGATGWGENIALSFALRYQSGALFYEPLKPGEPFLDANQKPLLPHSYESFARTVVEQWMNSEHHRENILDRDWTHFGAACTGLREKNGFPKLNCTQDFTRIEALTPSRAPKT